MSSAIPQKTIAALQRQLAERTADGDQAIAQQTETAEVSRVINSSPSDPRAGIHDPPAAQQAWLQRMPFFALASAGTPSVTAGESAAYGFTSYPRA